ncbi:hypothetical protein Emin_0473 [Elusimicrobium minutum Pei191]|uniref:Uncharacterized protein n=1 Tax=Elusimicrobium minutum (strain Pei191) TaxID=445932 RepID=B2KBK8_ELUMP|nr:hypothetical protein Emin_0473 [Elusimicrobium minutum Pei191]
MKKAIVLFVFLSACVLGRADQAFTDSTGRAAHNQTLS